MTCLNIFYPKLFCGGSLPLTNTELAQGLGAPEGLTGSGSGLKSLRRWGKGLESHPTDWESQGSNKGPLCTRWVVYPLHHSGSWGVSFHSNWNQKDTPISLEKNCWKKYFKRSCRVKAFSPAKTAMIVMPGKSITNLLKVCLFKIFLLPGVSRQHDNKLN